MQPIQDQIFTAVQEIATNKKYDFIFDKSADVVMLYSADKFNVRISDIERWNSLSRNKYLQPGQRLKLSVDVTNNI